MNRLMVTATVAVVGAAAFALEIEVSRQFPVESRASDLDTYTVRTEKQESGYPAFVAKPVFWFDCQDTNGWEFATGTMNVTKIPAKAGSTATDRYLEVNCTDGTWNGWNNGATPMVAPSFIPSDPSLGGHPVLDFGAIGSRHALRFSKNASDANLLDGIGTIVAVWGSQRTGGWILGGGPDSCLYSWHRGLSRATSYNGIFNINNPVFHGGANASLKNGVVRHNGLPTAGQYTGFNHAWEVLSVQPTAADNSAVGIGIGDGRNNHTEGSGGMNVAEMLIFDRVLTIAEVEALENYLTAKWLDREPEGWNGNATLAQLNHRANPKNSLTAEPSTSVLDVPEGETLTVGDLKGGMARARVRKNGAGTLILNGAADFTGEIVLNGGTLRFVPRRIPTFDELSKDVYMRFDASDLSTVDTVEGSDGLDYVDAWASLGSGKLYGSDICLRQSESPEKRRPILRKNALGAGLNVVDFKNEINDDKGGAFMYFSTNRTDATTVKVTPWGLTTVVALFGAQGGGGRTFLSNDYYVRDGQGVSYGYTCQRLYKDNVADTVRGIKTSDGRVWANGVETSPTNGFEVSGYQAVAWKVPGDEATYLGSYMSGSIVKHSGGFRLGEVFIYDRELDDQEIRDVQAYLMDRWLGQEAPGYARNRTRHPGPDYQNVTVTAPTAVYVAEGATLRIGRLTLAAPLTKTGGGALEYESCEAVTREGQVVISGGTACQVGGPDVSSACQIAAGAALHVDATDAATLEIEEENGVKYVRRWYGKDFNNSIYCRDTARPWLNETKTLNGHPTVDFGSFGGQGKYMLMDRGSDSIRTVYAVLDHESGGGWLMGSDTAGPHKDFAHLSFHRQYRTVGGASIPVELLGGFDDSLVLRQGESYTNGASINPATAIFTNGVALLEFHALGGVSASQIGEDRNQWRRGGFRLGEMLVYERPLSEREKVATRNYLMQKWFGVEPKPLPEDEPAAMRIITLSVSGVQDMPGTAEICNIVGTGVLDKAEAGTVCIADMGGFTGTVNVAAGTLKLTGGDAVATPAFDPSGLVFWAEGNGGIVATTPKNGFDWVTRWTSRLDDGWAAVTKYGTGAILNELDFALKANTWVDMPVNNALKFQKDGVDARLDGIKSVFWVLGSQRGGGILMGGGGAIEGAKLGIAWLRANYRTPAGATYVGNTNLCALLHGASGDEQRAAAWRINGVPADPMTDHLSGGWDVVSMVTADDDSTSAADGFAFDGRDSRDCGNQALGEVLVYNRRLVDSERAALESYLACKYGFLHEAATNVAVNVAAGAMLDLDGQAQAVQWITGGGSVANGTLAVTKLIADGAATAWPSVESLSLADGQVVELRNLPSDLDNKTIRILSAASLVGFEHLRNVVFAGENVPETVRARLRFVDGELFVAFKPMGMRIFAR